MNKHQVLFLVTLLTVGACKGPTQLAVRAASSGPEGEIVGRPQLVIRLLPYDRDSIFSVLTGRASRPEPQAPADLVELRDSIAVAQSRWRDAEASWNDSRSELQSISEKLKGLSRSSPQYFRLYQRFDDLEGQERRLNREKDRYFEAFTELQSVYNMRRDSFNAVVETWGDQVFADYGEIIDSLLKVGGREELADTTDAAGWALFAPRSGRWYVHARSKLLFEELYWNHPIDVAGGTIDTLVLDESNAELRPIF